MFIISIIVPKLFREVDLNHRLLPYEGSVLPLNYLEIWASTESRTRSILAWKASAPPVMRYSLIVVGSVEFESTTSYVSGKRSNQLSYDPI